MRACVCLPVCLARGETRRAIRNNNLLAVRLLEKWVHVHRPLNYINIILLLIKQTKTEEEEEEEETPGPPSNEHPLLLDGAVTSTAASIREHQGDQ